jgi:hypothetical protein
MWFWVFWRMQHDWRHLFVRLFHETPNYRGTSSIVNILSPPRFTDVAPSLRDYARG